MPYVDRGDGGAIATLFAQAQREDHEYLPDDDAEIVAFLTPPALPPQSPIADDAEALRQAAKPTYGNDSVLALHGAVISLVHTIEGIVAQIGAPLPADFAEWQRLVRQSRRP